MRAPAYPLITLDPTLSVWSREDRLTDDWSKHWTGTTRGWLGLLRIDGQAYRFLGLHPEIPALPQTGVEVQPTRTIYTFSDGRIALAATFCTPALPGDLDLLARPAAYLHLAVRALDGRSHVVQAYLDVSLEWATNQHQDLVAAHHLRLDGLVGMRGYCPKAVELGSAGDDHRCNWGAVVLAAAADPGLTSAISSQALGVRLAWARGHALPTEDLVEFPRPASSGYPMMILAWDLGQVAGDPVTRQAVIAYDERHHVEYLGRRLPPYWRRNGLSFPSLLKQAVAEGPEILTRCAAADAQILADLRRVGGEAYATLGALAWRQCFAAHALAVDLDGRPLHLSKENFSNGCIATVDVTYPGAPFFLHYAPELLKAQLWPILDYARTSRWKFPFAPHDLGVYPLANGQVYGGGEETDLDQMPVEECGNLVILVCALHRLAGQREFARQYWDLLTRWTDYLVAKGLDPEHQLCTDDFAGHLAHNANLAIKAIIAIAAYAQAAGDLDPERAPAYRAKAEAMAREWTVLAADGDHYRLTFDRPGTWSQKYNLVWDRLLGLELFPASVARTELAHYRRVQTPFGLALDSRQAYAKLDWTVWSACLAESTRDFRTLVDPLAAWIAATPTRVPLTDWYWLTDGRQAMFQARSVVGGVFIGLLAERLGLFASSTRAATGG